jgi:hypothetical protein
VDDKTMKTNWAMLLSGVVIVAAAGVLCSEDKPAQNPRATPQKAPAAQASTPSANLAPASDYPVIGTLEKRDRTITIKAGPKGTLYSVKTKDGQVLFENVPAEQLQAQAPELHQFIKGAVAGGSGKSGTLDARLDGRN